LPYRPLIPLRIPAGWEVRFNNFVELGPPEALAPEDRDAYLSQDVLAIRSTAPAGPSAGYALDVGWSADGDPTGEYRLTVFGPGAQSAAIRLASSSAEVIRDAVAVCLYRLNEGAPPERIQGLLDDATRHLS
jgi:hypothetical protein